jgi:hypothetical protein
MTRLGRPILIANMFLSLVAMGLLEWIILIEALT